MDPPARLPFADRVEAGAQLAAVLPAGLEDPVVLALPRGGVPVAAVVATYLDAPLDVLVARKVAAPGQPELAIGSVSEEGVRVADDRALRALGIDAGEFARMATTEQAELERQIATYRPGRRALPPVEHRDVVLVDDGIATGLTAAAAIRSLRRLDPSRVILAAPVCAPDASRRLEGSVDQMVCGCQPEDFVAVGRWYRTFDQISDGQVIEILDQFRSRRGPPAP